MKKYASLVTIVHMALGVELDMYKRKAGKVVQEPGEAVRCRGSRKIRAWTRAKGQWERQLLVGCRRREIKNNA